MNTAPAKNRANTAKRLGHFLVAMYGYEVEDNGQYDAERILDFLEGIGQHLVSHNRLRYLEEAEKDPCQE